RPLDKHQGGLWEFPGGKVEAGESVQVALARELLEELGIEVTRAQPLIQVRHDYPDKQVLLDVWQVLAFRGEAHGAEGQPLAWVTASELDGFEFPAANRPIVSAAQLPDRYLITPEGLDTPQLLCGIERALARGVRLVQLRAPGMPLTAYRTLAADALALAAGQAQLMLKGPAELLGECVNMPERPVRCRRNAGWQPLVTMPRSWRWRMDWGWTSLPCRRCRRPRPIPRHRRWAGRRRVSCC